MRFEPALEVGPELSKPVETVREHLGNQLHAVGAGHDHFHDVLDRVDPTAHREAQLQLCRQDCQPAQPQQDVSRGRQLETMRHLELLEVDVGLIEPIEKHEPIGVGALESPREVRERRVVRGELHSEGASVP